MAAPLERLRAATRAHHERLDASPWLAEATRDLNAYARHIAVLEAFYRDVDDALSAFEDVLAVANFEPERRRKSPVLARERSELAARGYAAAAVRAAFPVPATVSAAVGIYYVLEGSTLGGTLIAQRVRDRLGWTSRFYGVYGPATAPMWRAFGAAVDGLGERLDVDAMIAAAAAAFDIYGARVAGLPPLDSAGSEPRAQ